ncbi:MAG: hypothetical protein U0T73_12030 [Chitinophagales bacterium]
MYIKHQLDKVLVTLDIAGENALFIVMARNGELIRKGDGSAGNALPLLKTVSRQGHFDAFMSTFAENVFAYSGVFDKSPYHGRQCTLLIVFNGPNDAEAGFKCMYGEDSEGPPLELSEMVINAVKLTETWYRESIAELNTQSVTRLKPDSERDKKKSWQFWK